jgi:hypothetical protein
MRANLYVYDKDSYGDISVCTMHKGLLCSRSGIVAMNQKSTNSVIP